MYVISITIQVVVQEVTVVGTSMGASTIWSYIELFGEDCIARAVFVDQAPLQVQIAHHMLVAVFDCLVDNQVGHKVLMHVPKDLISLDRQECQRQASCKINGIFAKLLCTSVCGLVPMDTTAAAVNTWKASNIVMSCMS